MYIDDNGTVQYEKETCVGCFSCIMVYPYGAIAQEGHAYQIVSKCDLCPVRDVPACIANCPDEILVYVEEEIE